jgi:hypothetical protein
VLGYDTTGDGRLDAFDTNQVWYRSYETEQAGYHTKFTYKICLLHLLLMPGAFGTNQDGRIDVVTGAAVDHGAAAAAALISRARMAAAAVDHTAAGTVVGHAPEVRRRRARAVRHSMAV